MPPVGRVDITAADAVGTAPITTIEMPANGGKPLAEDWQNVAAMALANDANVRTGAGGLDKMVLKAGDTMTGQLVISPSTAVEGALISGGTGLPGAILSNGTPQTSTAPTCAASATGFVQLLGDDPNKGVDPGGNDVLHGANITKAWGVVSLTGGAPFATTDDYNVTNVTEPVANIYQINFVRAFANATYAVTFTPHAPGIGVSLSTKTTTTCRFNVWDTTAPGTPAPNQTVDFIAVGRQ